MTKKTTLYVKTNEEQACLLITNQRWPINQRSVIKEKNLPLTFYPLSQESYSFSLWFLTFSVTTSTKICFFTPFCWKNKQTVAISVKAMLFFSWLVLLSAHRAVSSSGSHPASWINHPGSKCKPVWAQKSALQTCFQPEHFQFTALQCHRKYNRAISNSNIFETKLSSMLLGLFLSSSSSSL